MSEFAELVLSFDPFAGDFDSTGDRTLSDAVVKARKPGECHTCATQIVPGEMTRRRTDIADGELMSFRWCEACCKAMASDDFDAYEARVAIGDKARRAPVLPEAGEEA